MLEPLFPRRQPCPCGSGKKFKDCCEPDAPRIDVEALRRAEGRAPGTIEAMGAGLDREIESRA